MEAPAHAKTIASAAQQFLQRQKAQVSLGEITAGRFDTLQRCVHHFTQFIGGASGVNRVNGAMLEGYHTHLIEEMKANKWSVDYTQVFLIAAKQFVRWCYKTELIDNLPRNISDLRFKVEPKKIPTFAVDEVSLLLEHAVDRTKLFLLLMLNTGMTQKDISDLKPDEVDWIKGRIRRKRSKHKEDTAPEIEYPLWKPTFRLLKQFGNREGERVLTNEAGGPLKVVSWFSVKWKRRLSG
jgi:integrase